MNKKLLFFCLSFLALHSCIKANLITVDKENKEQIKLDIYKVEGDEDDLKNINAYSYKDLCNYQSSRELNPFEKKYSKLSIALKSMSKPLQNLASLIRDDKSPALNGLDQEKNGIINYIFDLCQFIRYTYIEGQRKLLIGVKDEDYVALKSSALKIADALKKNLGYETQQLNDNEDDALDTMMALLALQISIKCAALSGKLKIEDDRVIVNK